MGAASDHARSCTTAAELKSNVARCLHSPRVIRPALHAIDQPSIVWPLLSISSNARCHRPFTSESNYDLPVHRFVIFLCSQNTHFLSLKQTCRFSLSWTFLINTESAKCHFEFLLISSRLSRIQRYNYLIIIAFDCICFSFLFIFFSYHFFICYKMAWKYFALYIVFSNITLLEK